MHEGPVVEELLKMVAEASGGQGTRVTRIRLTVGEATGYMEASLKFYLGVLGKGTIAEGAELDITYAKSVLRCRACGSEWERKKGSNACPSCGGAGVLTERGREFILESIEVAEKEA